MSESKQTATVSAATIGGMNKPESEPSKTAPKTDAPAKAKAGSAAEAAEASAAEFAARRKARGHKEN